MPYLLDGNNLIGRARRQSRPGEEDRDALVAELCDRLRRTRARAILFFDGPAPTGATSLGSLSIRGSKGGCADEAILDEIRRARTPGEMTVVTADRDLARRARDAGARTLAPEAFWSKFGKTPSAGSGRAETVDVDDWVGYFGDEANRHK